MIVVDTITSSIVVFWVFFFFFFNFCWGEAFILNPGDFFFLYNLWVFQWRLLPRMYSHLSTLEVQRSIFILWWALAMVILAEAAKLSRVCTENGNSLVIQKSLANHLFSIFSHHTFNRFFKWKMKLTDVNISDWIAVKCPLLSCKGKRNWSAQICLLPTQNAQSGLRERSTNLISHLGSFSLLTFPRKLLRILWGSFKSSGLFP